MSFSAGDQIGWVVQTHGRFDHRHCKVRAYIFVTLYHRLLFIPFSHCTGLHVLELDGCENIPPTAICELAEHRSGLRVLTLRDCRKVSPQALTTLTSKCGQLQRLSLAKMNARLTDAALVSIASQLAKHSTLTSLSLSWCTRFSGMLFARSIVIVAYLQLTNRKMLCYPRQWMPKSTKH